MMRNVWLVLPFLFCSISLLAQNAETLKKDSVIMNREITFKDGSKIRCRLIREDDQRVIIRTQDAGVLKLWRRDIESIEIIKEETINELTEVKDYYDNQFGQKYLFFPTAIGCEAKKWYYTNQYVYISGFAYGVSKYISTGISFFSPSPLVFFTPWVKATFNPDARVKVAVNAQYLLVTSDNKIEGIGLFQALVTSGSSQNNITVGAGKFYSGGGFANGTLLTIGFIKKVTGKLSILSQNHLLIGNYSTNRSFGMLSLSMRFDRKKHSFEVGALAPTGNGFNSSSLVIIPYVGYNLKLSR